MKVERQQVGTVDVLTPVGALIDQDAESFSRLLLERLQTPNPRVIVSLQEVAYLDGVGIEGLLDATDALAARGASLKLVRVPPTCREILELTGVSMRFSFFEDVHDAVKSFL